MDNSNLIDPFYLDKIGALYFVLKDFDNSIKYFSNHVVKLGSYYLDFANQ